MVSGISSNVVKIRLIRLGSCRSAIELRPQINNLTDIRWFFSGHLVDTNGRRTCPTNALILIVSARSSVLGNELKQEHDLAKVGSRVRWTREVLSLLHEADYQSIRNTS
jgi:hypothetical protein